MNESEARAEAKDVETKVVDLSKDPCIVCGSPGKQFLVNWSPVFLCLAHEQWTDKQIFAYLGTRHRSENLG